MRALVCLLLISNLSALAASADGASSAAETKAAVTKLVAQLGSADFEAREEAEKSLVALGQRGLTIVAEVSVPDDAEIQTRLKRIRLACALESVKTIGEALVLRKQYTQAQMPALAAAALKKAASLGTPLEFTTAVHNSVVLELKELKKAWSRDDHKFDSRLYSMMEELNLCIDLLETHLAANPEDKMAVEKQQEAAMLFYSCRKYIRLNR